MEDSSTLTRQPRDGALGAPGIVPALTLISHPKIQRSGERVLLRELKAGRELALSRTEPGFMRPGSILGLPLADPFLSRKPLRLLPGAQGGVRLVVGASPQVFVDGSPLTGELELTPSALAAGVTLELAERVVLLLHMAEPVDKTEADELGMVGQSAGVRRVRRQVLQVADLDVPVLIRGETGTGKELVAQALHQQGRRRKGPFISVNLGAIPKELAASELFGAEKGAYTGASQSREGFFRAAQGGTLFLDEVAEASSEVQAMLLRVLETGEMFSVGGRVPIKTQVRLVAATDARLEERIQQGSFRAPLLHRLSGYEIRVPPLRERREDLGLLLLHFARQELELLGELWRLEGQEPSSEPWLPTTLASRLVRYPWPGNVRQLRNVTRQLVISSRGLPSLQVDPQLEQELGSLPVEGSAPVVSLKGPTEARRKPAEVSEEEMMVALREHGWDLAAASNQLGITRASLYNLMKKSTKARTAKDLSVEQLRESYLACGGDLEQMSKRLEVSVRALQRRVRELGLESD
ncbi:sigma-54 dependent transcriptional regulator [Myxococcus sp. K38C18041901]|uniref:sigma 54-interacting transcriptional regulator n=1 Tax=Myxococcus guangdongensis TaxID=2906760 RepID=UPI0020A7A6A3|nr:sigma 54-interacting transcriptional regulator [Myxococcus guangdongensis]MCP3064820.1 sigma-54 dependent transcriptional regulator [Myxococcus guangdongensis]